jgi:hypothetical protein
MVTINTNDVVKAFIEKNHGWVVARCFESTFYNDDAFTLQHLTALENIQDTVRDLIESNCFSTGVNTELEYYLENLTEFLQFKS